MTKHFLTLRPLPYSLIKAHKKTIEMRLYDEKRKLIKVGDILCFENADSHEMIECEVMGLKRFPSFKEMYEYYDPVEIGYEKDSHPNYEDMYSYYPKERIEKYGTLAIKIKLLK